MEIIVNDTARTVATEATLADLLQQLAVNPQLTAVAHNGAIVPRDRYPAVRLSAGDRLEIVTLVGGG